MDVRSALKWNLERTRNWHAVNRAARTNINALFLLADGSSNGAAEIYAEMERMAGTATFAGSSDAILARLARLLDRPDAAAKHFEDFQPQDRRELAARYGDLFREAARQWQERYPDADVDFNKRERYKTPRPPSPKAPWQ